MPTMLETRDRTNTRTRMAATGDPAAPLRIALVAPPYFEVPPEAYGGVEAVLADLADALVDRGHHVTLVGAGHGRTRARFEAVWARPMPHRLGEPAPEIVHAALTRRAVQRLADTSGLDVVHEHTLAGVLNAPSYAHRDLPTVVTMHGPVDDDARRLYGALGEDINLVAISRRQQALAPELPWAGMVHNAVRVDTFPFRRDKEPFALFLGRFHPQKGAHLALDTAHAAGVPLVLAGKCSEPIEKEYFEREVRPRLTENDEVFGVADAVEKRRLLSAARCLLFPIQWEEPFGVVMIEAMACGTPVVALRGGAVDEVVRPGVTGFICDDVAGLSRAVHDLGAIDPAACRQHVADHFDIGSLGCGYEAVYRRVITAARTLDRSPANRRTDLAHHDRRPRTAPRVLTTHR